MSNATVKNSVLVTGGAGYIGSHTCKALARSGFRPIVMDNLTTGYRHNVKWGPLVVGDVSNKDHVRHVLRTYRPIAVMHFAGSAYIGESMICPEKYYRNNTVATLALLETLHEENVNTLVFSSTCATYGMPDQLPLDVTHPQRPISPYGFSKFVAEQMILEFGRVHGLKFGLLRYFNAAGGDEEGELKEEHLPETHLIPLALASAFGVGPTLRVFGDDYPTPDGTCIRDYIDVSCLAAAHVKTMVRLVGGREKMEIRNLGSGRGYSVKEIISTISEVTGRRVKVKYHDRRLGDPPELWAKPDAEFASMIGDNHLERIILSASLAFK